jgi:hypothetical protein
MKLMALVALLITSAFANDYVVLDSSRVELESSVATLEKNHYTPSVVNLSVPVVHRIDMCDPRDERTERYSCDETDTYYDPYCYGGPIGGGIGYPRGPRGPRYNPPRTSGRVVVRGGTRTGRVIVRSRPVERGCWRTRVIRRTCTRTICTNPYTIDEVRTQNFELSFENYTKDAILNFSLDQYGNLTLLPTTISAGCTVLTKYGEGSNVTGAKLKLKRRCR